MIMIADCTSISPLKRGKSSIRKKGSEYEK